MYSQNDADGGVAYFSPGASLEQSWAVVTVNDGKVYNSDSCLSLDNAINFASHTAPAVSK